MSAAGAGRTAISSVHPHQRQPLSKSAPHAWSAVNAALAMDNVLVQCYQERNAEIVAMQPELNRWRAEYLKALDQNSPNKAEFEAVLNQLVEKEKALMEEKKALISSLDKLVDKLPGAQPVCVLNCMCPAECCT